MYCKFKQGTLLKHVTLCMGDTTMYADTCILKNNMKVVFLLMQMKKSRGLWVFAVRQESKYKIVLTRLFVATQLFSKLFRNLWEVLLDLAFHLL